MALVVHGYAVLNVGNIIFYKDDNYDRFEYSACGTPLLSATPE